MSGGQVKTSDSLEDQVGKILLGLSKGHPLPTPKERSEVLQEVAADLKSSFLKCTVLAYGLDEIGISEDATGLYLSVDTYGKVDVGGKNLHGSILLSNSASNTVIAQQIFRILTTNSSSYQYISIKQLTVYANTAFGNLMPAPSQEISFIHSRTNAKCKIRLENYFSVQKSRLFNFYSRLDVRFWPLLMLVRHWGTTFEALRSADTLDFQNYALSLLLVHFLVSKKILPSLKELQSARDSGIDKAFIVNNFDLSFCTNISVVKPAGGNNPALQDKELRTFSIVSILKGFFLFCSTFDFKSNVICPYLGQSLDRELFYPKTDWKTLPESLTAGYLNGVDGKTRPEKLYLGGPICLQDIFELTTNVTRPVSEDEASRFKTDCGRTALILEDALNQSGSVVFSDAFSVDE